MTIITKNIIEINYDILNTMNSFLKLKKLLSKL